MTLLETQNAIKNITKGQIVKIHYKTEKGDYTKETHSLVRFVQYSHINGVEVKGKPNKNETFIIPNILIYNSNTNQYYLQIATIQTNVKAKVKYYYKGVEITKEQYEQANPPKPNQSVPPVFKKNIKDIIELGQ